MSATSSSAPQVALREIDGRTARKNSNRDAVIEAALQLFESGVKNPKMEDFAEIAGVSVRSAYRYFNGVDEVIQAAIIVNLSRYGALFEFENIGRGTLPERIHSLVSARLNLMVTAYPMVTAVLKHVHEDSPIGTQVRSRLQHMYLKNTEMFGTEFSKMTAVESRQISAAIDSLLGYQSMDSMLNRLGFSVEEAVAAVVHALELLLRPWQFEDSRPDNTQTRGSAHTQPPA